MAVMKEIAIVGIGRWGKNLIREFNKLEKQQSGTKITQCLTGSSADNIKWLKKNFPQIYHTKDYKEILENKEIDSVIIATPTSTHYDLALQALNAGKNVFVEKPPSSNLSESRHLVKIANSKGKILFSDHIFLYTAIFQKLVKLLKQDKLTSCFSCWQKRGTFKGDIILDLGYHEIYTAIYLLGNPQKVKLIEHQGFITKGDIVSFILYFTNNRKYHCYINRMSEKKYINKTIIGKKNSYIMTDKILYKIYKGKGSINTVKQPLSNPGSINNNPLQKVCRDFIKCIKGNPKILKQHHSLILQTMGVIEQLNNQK